VVAVKDDEKAGGDDEQRDGEEDETDAVEDARRQHPVLPHLRLVSQSLALLLLDPRFLPQQRPDVYEYRIGKRGRCSCRLRGGADLVDEAFVVAEVLGVVSAYVGVRRRSPDDAQRRRQPPADNPSHLRQSINQSFAMTPPIRR